MKNGYNDYFKSLNQNKKKSSHSSGAKAQQRKVESSNNKASIKSSQRKSRNSFPLVGLLSFGAMLSLTALYLTDPGIVERIGKSIQIGFVSKSLAAEEKKSPAGTEDGANKSQSKTSVQNSPNEKTGKDDLEDGNYISKLNERKSELDRREVALNELEGELHKQRLEIEERIKQLEQLRGNLSGMLQEKVDVDDAKVAKLVEFYANMKPKQAAEIISTVNEDLAVEILGRMKKKNAAEILNLLPPKKAQMFSERYAGYSKK